jgi:hypothetical protein
MYQAFLFILLVALAMIPAQSPASQTCRTADLSPSTPASRFAINNDGTVTDTLTGLNWKRCSEGLTGLLCEEGAAERYTWKGAIRAAENSRFAGKKDWRLPTIKELDTIVEYQCTMPAINSAIFPATPASNFWSSSPYAGYANGAWNLNFNDGVRDSCSMNFSLYLRLVRTVK